ncbi:MAG: PPC domain-containing DNA-binding protein [Thermoplasmatota archaeon]
MEVSRHGDVLIIRMHPGEEIVTSMVDACRNENAVTAVVLSSIGQLRDFTLGFFVEKGNYDPVRFSEPHELLSISGMIIRTSEGFEPHLHACLAGRSRSAVGGHLIGGTVSITNETVIQLNIGPADREFNSETGLKDLKPL